MIHTRALVFIAAATLSAPAAQAAEAWTLDKPHTQVLFTVNHLGFTDLTGQFRVVDAELHLDSTDWSSSSVSATIDAASIDMNHDGLNRHLKNADFFDVENFPHLSFRSTAISEVGEGRLKMDGELSMIGTTLPVSLDVTLNKLGAHPMRGTPWVGFRAEGSLKRSDWGMTYAVPAVGDEIGIVINLEAAGPVVEE